MILVDTSIWIRYLAGAGPEDRLDDLLHRGKVAGHELIHGELLVGDRGGRAEFLACYAKIHHAATAHHRDVVAFVRDRNLHGRGVGWIDMHLLASALIEGFQLWTADARLASLAEELGVAWGPASSTVN